MHDFNDWVQFVQHAASLWSSEQHLKESHFVDVCNKKIILWSLVERQNWLRRTLWFRTEQKNENAFSVPSAVADEKKTAQLYCVVILFYFFKTCQSDCSPLNSYTTERYSDCIGPQMWGVARPSSANQTEDNPVGGFCILKGTH